MFVSRAKCRRPVAALIRPSFVCVLGPREESENCRVHSSPQYEDIQIRRAFVFYGIWASCSTVKHLKACRCHCRTGMNTEVIR